MTGTNVLEASFSELAAACRLDYRAMKHGKKVYDLDEPTDEELKGLKYPDGGLLQEAKFFWKLLTRTIMPDDDEPNDTTDLGFSDAEILMAMKSRVGINIVDWMVDVMMENRRDESCPLVLQPYIMALVLLKLPNLKADLHTKHQEYNKVFKLSREVIGGEQSSAAVPSDQSFVPPTSSEDQDSIPASNSGPAPMEVEGHEVPETSVETAHSVASATGYWNPGQSSGDQNSGA